MHVFMLSCIKHACFHVFSAYFSPHDIIAEKGLLYTAAVLLEQNRQCCYEFIFYDTNTVNRLVVDKKFHSWPLNK